MEKIINAIDENKPDLFHKLIVVKLFETQLNGEKLIEFWKRFRGEVQKNQMEKYRRLLESFLRRRICRPRGPGASSSRCLTCSKSRLEGPQRR